MITREILTQAAVLVAKRTGDYTRVSYPEVAAECGVSPRLPQYYFGTTRDMRTAIMDYAIENELLPIIAQGITHGHPSALAVPTALRRRAAKSLI